MLHWCTFPPRKEPPAQLKVPLRVVPLLYREESVVEKQADYHQTEEK
jgi:hypothetical protein